jgi:hypothetical protein
MTEATLVDDEWIVNAGENSYWQTADESITSTSLESYVYPTGSGYNNTAWIPGERQTEQVDANELSLELHSLYDPVTTEWATTGTATEHANKLALLTGKGSGKYDFSTYDLGIHGPHDLEAYGYITETRSGVIEDAVEVRLESTFTRVSELAVDGTWELTAAKGVNTSSNQTTEGYTGQLNYAYPVQGGQLARVQAETDYDFTRAAATLTSVWDADTQDWISTGTQTQTFSGYEDFVGSGKGIYATDGWERKLYGPPSLEVDWWGHNQKHGTVFDANNQHLDYTHTIAWTLNDFGQWAVQSGLGITLASGVTQRGYTGEWKYTHPVRFGQIVGTEQQSSLEQSDYSLNSQLTLDVATNEWTTTGQLVQTQHGTATTSKTGVGQYNDLSWQLEVNGPPTLEAYGWGKWQQAGQIAEFGTTSQGYSYTTIAAPDAQANWLTLSGVGSSTGSGALQQTITGQTDYAYPIVGGQQQGTSARNSTDITAFQTSSQAQLDLTTGKWQVVGSLEQQANGQAFTTTTAAGTYARPEADHVLTGTTSATNTGTETYTTKSSYQLHDRDWLPVSGTYSAQLVANGQEGFTGTTAYETVGGKTGTEKGTGTHTEAWQSDWSLDYANTARLDSTGKWTPETGTRQSKNAGVANYAVNLLSETWSYDAEGLTTFQSAATSVLQPTGQWLTDGQSEVVSHGKGGFTFHSRVNEDPFLLNYAWKSEYTDLEVQTGPTGQRTRSSQFAGEGLAIGSSITSKTTTVSEPTVSGTTSSYNQMNYAVDLGDTDEWTETTTRVQQANGTWLQASESAGKTSNAAVANYSASGTYSTNLNHQTLTYHWTQNDGGNYSASGSETSRSGSSWTRVVGVDGSITGTNTPTQSFTQATQGNSNHQWNNTTYLGDGRELVDSGSVDGPAPVERLPQGVAGLTKAQTASLMSQQRLLNLVARFERAYDRTPMTGTPPAYVPPSLLVAPRPVPPPPQGTPDASPPANQVFSSEAGVWLMPDTPERVLRQVQWADKALPEADEDADSAWEPPTAAPGNGRPTQDWKEAWKAALTDKIVPPPRRAVLYTSTYSRVNGRYESEAADKLHDKLSWVVDRLRAKYPDRTFPFPDRLPVKPVLGPNNEDLAAIDLTSIPEDTFTAILEELRDHEGKTPEEITSFRLFAQYLEQATDPKRLLAIEPWVVPNENRTDLMWKAYGLSDQEQAWNEGVEALQKSQIVVANRIMFGFHRGVAEWSKEILAEGDGYYLAADVFANLVS